MLQFMRRHQRYFFLVITVVIVISFSFFGTYNAIGEGGYREQVAFTNVVGQPVSRHELDEMVLFIGTDSEDKLHLGGLWGPNFLNDGVIKKDFLETGLLPILTKAYPDDVKLDLASRLEKEKRFQLYRHPTASFITTENAWQYFVPTMAAEYSTLVSATNPLDASALNARIGLYLNERRFPPYALKQVLRYQEKQASLPQTDPSLVHADLALFGYHTVEDWFGPRLVRIIGEFILNVAAIAEKQGYVVTKAEALADLKQNADSSFKQIAANGMAGVSNSTEYFNEQLRRMGLDQTQASKIWRNVLLFRALFQDMGNSVFLAPQAFQNFALYAKQTLDGDLYRLPDAIRIKDFGSLQKLEVYLDAIGKRGKDKLSLPTKYLSVEEVAKNAPELIQKRYVVEIKSVDKKELAGRIGLKETWNWEVADANWGILKKRFPELAAKPANTKEERFALLDALDDKTRGRIDNMARNALIDNDAALLSTALQESKARKEEIVLRLKGPNKVIHGLDDASALINLLDEAIIGNAPSEKLAQYSADGKTFYSIVVLEKSPEAEIALYDEANKSGALDLLLKKKLEAHYISIREKKPAEYQKEDKSWKELDDVKEKVANDYFAGTLKAIKTDYSSSLAPLKAPDSLPSDTLASLRFFAYARAAKESLQKSEGTANPYIKGGNSGRDSLSSQWLLVQVPFTLDRSTNSEMADKLQAFALGENQWTKVYTPPNGDVSFFHLKKKGDGLDLKAIAGIMGSARTRLGNDAQQLLMNGLLFEIKAQNAISLSYLDKGLEMETPLPDQAEDEN